MNENITKALDIIADDEELSLELINKKTMDEVYDFCVSVYGGYTMEDLDEYMDKVITDEQIIDDISNENKLEKISGGKGKNFRNKMMAMSLAPLMLLSPSYSPVSAGGGDLHATPGTVRTVASAKSKPSFWQRHKKKIIAAGIIGALLLGGGLLYRHFSKSKEKETGNEGSDSKSKNNAPKSSKKNGQRRRPDDDPDQDDDEYDSKPSTSVYKEAEKNWDSFTSWWRGVPFIGKAILVGATGGVAIERLGSLARSINNISGAMWPISNMADKINSWRKHLINNMNNKPRDLHESVDNLEYLFKEVKGQEKAKEEVRSIVYGILHQKKHAQLTGKEYKKGDVLYFVGPSRVGKSLMATGLAKYKILSPYDEPYRISASEIDSESRKETVMDQLFGMSHYGGYDDYGYYGGGSGGGGNNAISKPKNLVKYISEHPNGIVIIDEYDKMWSKTLDEVFRTIVDNGVVNIKGQTIDCSGITFILTSNESTQSIRGGNQDKEGNVDDGTGSRTYIKHDKSFLNRIRPVEFDNLSAKEYEEIIRTEFKSDLIDYWILPESGGIDIVIREKAVEDMAKAVERKNQGASYSVQLRNDLFCAITDKVFTAEEKQKQKGYYNGKKIFVDFDLRHDKFILKDEEELNSESKAEEKSEVKSEVKPELKLKSKLKSKLKIKPEVKPEVKPEAKPEAKPEVKPESKNQGSTGGGKGPNQSRNKNGGKGINKKANIRTGGGKNQSRGRKGKK